MTKYSHQNPIKYLGHIVLQKLANMTGALPMLNVLDVEA